MVINSLQNTTHSNTEESNNFTQIYKYEDAYAESLKYFNNNDFAAKIFVDKYALRDKEDRLVEKTPEDTHRRLAREFARIEKNKFKNPLTEDQIFYYLDKFAKIIPQGSPMFAIGNPFQIVSSSNCFVIDSPLDSYSSILKTDEELAQISKRRGGVGLDISHIRPNGSLTSNSSRTSTGIVPFMCRYSNTIREVGQCLHGDTLVLTSSGLERIKNINKGDSVWTENGWKKVISTHQTNKETIKIKTKKGRTIICSKDHPFHTINGEKESSQFIKGDNVTYIVGQEWYGSDFILDPIEYKKSSYNNSNRLNEINYPEKLDTDFAYFIGYSYGDGFVSYDENKISGIYLSCDRKWKYISEKLIEISKKILNKENISFRERKNENCDEIRITSRCLVEFLQHNNLLKQKSENIEFPEKLLKAKKDILFSFISGYFDADGSVVKTKKAYKLSSINYSFLQTIQCIFSSFGICSTIRHSERKNNWKDIYELYINGKKSQKIFKNLMTESIKVSKITFNEKRRDCYRTEYKTENFSTNSSRHSYIIDNNQYLSYSTVERLASELSLENNYFLLQDEIKEISEYEKDTILYDIGLEDTHFFFANGLYAHNSGRRGALMLTISIHHPESVIPWDNSVDGEPYDVEVHNPSLGSFVISSKYYNPKKIDFATSKYDPSKVTGANISIRLSDEFLNALEKDDYFEQRWPVDSENPVIRKKVRAKDVWEKIIHSAWRTAEPGLLFWDTIIKESPADCYYDYGFRSVSTNPCAELPISVGDSCRLLALNLFGFIVNPFSDNAYFDYKNFYETSKIAQRLMDDLIDIELECVRRILNKIENDPEPEEIKSREKNLWLKVYESCENGRRTGTGILALGDTLAALNIKYGTEIGINETDKIYKTLKFACYQSSVEMAKELGSFKVWDKELEKDNPFLNRFKDESIDLGNGEIINGINIWNEMQRYGRRNISLLTTAPTGSISNLAKLVNNFGTSSGIEPQYSITPYTRKKKGNPGDKNFRSDSVDQNGDHWMHFKIYPSAVQEWMDITGENDITKSPWYKNTAEDLDWSLRVALQAKANAHIDHSISSTVNIPNNTSVEKVAEIYETAWRSKCKGITVYRDGCRTGVLVRENKDTNNKTDFKLHKTDAPKRPKSLECDVHHIKVQGEEYFVLVGIFHGEVYEIFAGKNGMISKEVKKGEIKKVKRGHYQAVLDNGEIIDNVCDFITDDQAAITRLASLSLRHGSDIKHCVTSLEKVPGDMTSLAKSMARALKKYIKDGEKQTGIECGSCGSENIIRQEGCITCRNCGWSKCS